MRKAGLTAMMFAVALFMMTASSKAQAATLFGDYLSEKGVDVEVTTYMDYYSKYVWRGMLLDDDNVYQPGVDVAIGGLTMGFWGSWDVEAEDSLTSDETDFYVDYSFDLGFLGEGMDMVGMSVGHTWYKFPEYGTNAQEYYIGVSFDTFLSPSLTWYHDYSDEASGGADGDYLIGSIGHSFTLSEEYGITLDLGEEIGYNDAYFIIGEGAYSLTSAALGLPLSDNVTLTATAAYSVPFGDLEDPGNGGNYDNEFYYGAGLAFAF